MKERPILFSAPMIAALLNGTKTQTRRGVKANGEGVRCPYGRPGDRLWVKETWRVYADYDALPPRDIAPTPYIQYAADDPLSPWASRIRQSIFMPRWASRISLAITEVRVEHLQAITAADARAEGVAGAAEYRLLWDVIHGADAWDVNPWVWVVVFADEHAAP